MDSDPETIDVYSAQLDDQRDQDVRLQANFSTTQTPSSVLKHALSLFSEPKNLFTGSLFLICQASLVSNRTIGFRKIGFGQCGLIYERPGRGYVVKVAKPGYSESLWQDCLAHDRVYQAFEKATNSASHGPECLVPRPYLYVAKDHPWWTSHAHLFESSHKDFSIPARAFVTERIWPLPKVVRHSLIDKFCPSWLRQAAAAHHANRDCLARIYLGRRGSLKAPAQPNFTLRNFNLCLDQMISLGIPICTLAAAMG